MKGILLAIAICCSLAASAQHDTIRSQVVHWNRLTIEKDSSRDRIQLLDGPTTRIPQLEIHASVLQKGKAPHPSHTHADMEELVIVKEGMLKVTISGMQKILGPGSVALALPGDEHGFENGGNTPVTYYVLKFKSASPLNTSRGREAGGSFMVNWDTLTVQKNEKGERRQVFNRGTSLFTKMELHVTALNAGQVSHAPHQHIAEEIILLRKGEGQMQIGNVFYPMAAGDLVFLASGDLHAFKNTGNSPCEYFALQWQ